MQTIWSRAIQAKSSCRCPSCLTTLSSVAKRPNTSAAGRSLRYGDIATFFYSSVLATAAVADAARKDSKRKTLDASIAEAVEALKVVELEQQKRLQILYSAQHELQVVERQRERRIQALRDTIGKTQLAQQTDSPQNTMGSSEKRQLNSCSAPEMARETLSRAGLAFRDADMMTDSAPHGDRILSLSRKHDNLAVVPGEISQGDNAIPAESINKKSTKNIVEELPYKMTSLAKSASEWLSYDESSMDLTKGRRSADLWLQTPWVGPLSDFKILVTNASIAKLIYRLLLICLDAGGPEGVVLDVGGTPWILRPQHRLELHEMIMNMSDRLQTLTEKMVNVKTITPIPFPRYSNRADHQIGEDLLHKALQNSLAETKNIDDLLLKICYDLLVSESPPSIHTYNMLIVRMCYLQHYQAVSAIIDSLFECKLRPNEITTAAVLRFYDYTNDLDAFRGYIGMMNGENNHGLITLSRTPEITPENKNHFIVMGERLFPCRHREPSILSLRGHFRSQKMYIEKAPRNRDTYMALISGWLSFSDLRSALTEYVTMIRSGWKPDHDILTALLSYCALKKEMSWGLVVWREIVETYERPDLVAYYWMLHLCTQAEESKTYEAVLQHGAARQIIPADMHSEAFIIRMEYPEKDNRLLAMLQEHIRIPGLAPLITPDPKVTQQSTTNISSFLAVALKDTDSDQLARAREHMVNLSTMTVENFERTNVDSKALVIEPHRYTSPKPPPGLSLWSLGKSSIQDLFSVPESAIKRSPAYGQVSYIPVEHSPEDELSQSAKLPAPHVSENTEWKNAIADHSLLGSQSPPSVDSIVVPEIPGKSLVLQSDYEISNVDTSISLTSTITSSVPEPKTIVSSESAVSSEDAVSQKDVPSIIVRTVSGKSSQVSKITASSQADQICNVLPHSKRLGLEQSMANLTESEEVQLTNHTACPSVIRRYVSIGEFKPFSKQKTSSRQNTKTRTVVPLTLKPGLKDHLGSANSDQQSQLSLRSVGHHSPYFVLNISQEAQASAIAEVG